MPINIKFTIEHSELEFTNVIDAAHEALSVSATMGGAAVKVYRCVKFTGQDTFTCVTMNSMTMPPEASELGMSIVDDGLGSDGKPDPTSLWDTSYGGF
jgi:hypothetical protein